MFHFLKSKETFFGVRSSACIDLCSVYSGKTFYLPDVLMVIVTVMFIVRVSIVHAPIVKTGLIL